MPTRFLVGGVIIFFAMMMASLSTYFKSEIEYYDVDDFLSQTTHYSEPLAEAASEYRQAGALEPAGQTHGDLFQLRGEVDYETVQRDGGLELRFDLVGREGRIPVVHEGIVPDTFDAAESVTVGGRLTDKGVFVADDLFVQCPSKYQAVSSRR